MKTNGTWNEWWKLYSNLWIRRDIRLTTMETSTMAVELLNRTMRDPRTPIEAMKRHAMLRELHMMKLDGLL